MHRSKIFIVTSYGFARAEQTLSQILPAIGSSKKILDIGSGLGHVSALLSKKGFEVTSIDLGNKLRLKEVKTIIYDGVHIPFGNREFDVALILTVLHHTKDPKILIEEALRVARSVVIIEDVYRTSLGKYFTYFIDSLLNWEWFFHPHQNKTETEWRALFSELGLRVIYIDRWFSLIGGLWPISQVLFKIER